MSSIFSAYNTPRGAPLVQGIYCLNLEFGVWEIGNFSTLMQTEVRCGLFILHFI